MPSCSYVGEAFDGLQTFAAAGFPAWSVADTVPRPGGDLQCGLTALRQNLFSFAANREPPSLGYECNVADLFVRRTRIFFFLFSVVRSQLINHLGKE